MKSKYSVLFRCFVALMVIAFLFSALPNEPVQARPLAAPLASETFENTTASGWSLIGNACLTAGSACLVTPNNEGNGNGWLRLTDNQNSEAGSAINTSSPIPTTNGVQITFTYADWGGTGADGFTFYLLNADKLGAGSPTVGGNGPGLGYSVNTSLGQNGVTDGYVGVAFDEWGNFEDSTGGPCPNGTGGSNPPPPYATGNQCMSGTSTGSWQYVSVRGSGSLGAGFNYLTGVPLQTLSTPETVDNVQRTAPRQVRITITPGPAPIYLTVEMNFGSGFQTIINKFNISGAAGQDVLPNNFYMGFSGSTGGSNDYHEIRGLTVNGAELTTSTTSSSSSTTTFGSTVTFTTTVTGSGSCKAPTGTISFNDGATLLGSSSLALVGGLYQAAFSTSSLSVGTHTINAEYSGDTLCASSNSSLTEVIDPASSGGSGSGSKSGKGSGGVTYGLSTASLPSTGFAPGMITKLSSQPSSKAYTSYGDLWLEIPSQKVSASIVGVPATENSWDISWLGDSVGWLNGTAFPSWDGNSVITGHVWNADNTPGVFVNLKNVKYGDKILVHEWGSVYTYEVTNSFLVMSNPKNVFEHSDTPQLTLLTCEDYNPFSNGYFFHRVVQARLTSAESGQ